MDGYLLDTNVVCLALLPQRTGHSVVASNVNKLVEAQNPVFVSAITLGEIAYGVTLTPNKPELTGFWQEITTSFQNVLDVTGSTADHYADLRARLFEKFSPKKGKARKRPEELLDPSTGKSLGIQENDLWLVAQAREFNLTFVSNDAMNALSMILAGELKLERWS